MRQSAPVLNDGESGNAPIGAPDEDVDQFDRGFAYVAAVCMAAVAVMAALAVFWPAS
jgi:ABC-type glucose/galactose transport system permease subunit